MYFSSKKLDLLRVFSSSNDVSFGMVLPLIIAASDILFYFSAFLLLIWSMYRSAASLLHIVTERVSDFLVATN